MGGGRICLEKCEPLQAAKEMPSRRQCAVPWVTAEPRGLDLVREALVGSRIHPFRIFLLWTSFSHHTSELKTR